jgi:hypothetical protein
MTTKRNRVIALLTMVSALALLLVLSSPSQAANLGLCRTGVCSASTAYCTDTCTYDGGSSGTATCGSLTSSCIRCGVRTIKHAQLIGQWSLESYPANFWFNRTELFCSNGQTTFLSNQCERDDKGLDRCVDIYGYPMDPQKCCLLRFRQNCWGVSSC